MLSVARACYTAPMAPAPTLNSPAVPAIPTGERRRMTVVPTTRTPTRPDKAGDLAWARARFELENAPFKTIAAEIGVSDTFLAGKAQREAWQRDPGLQRKLLDERDALDAEIYRKNREAARAEIVSVTAKMQSDILQSHRKDIKAARAIVTMLLEEMAGVTTNIDYLEDLGEMMRSPDERGRDKLNDIYRKVMTIPERSTALNTLATALKTLVLLERQAYAISGNIEDPEAQKTPDEVTKGLDKIMDKFDQVLRAQAPAPAAPAPAPMVVEVQAKEVSVPATN